MWSILESITEKPDWYTKVFNKKVVAKWESEVPNKDKDAFKFAIQILQGTSLGYKPSKFCDHVPKEDCSQCQRDYLDALSIEDIREWNDDKSKKEIKRILNSDVDPSLILKVLDIDDVFYDSEFDCTHYCDCQQAYNTLKYYVLSKTMPKQQELLDVIELICENEQPDWHPGSKEMVRNIVHPSLHCYIKGVTKLTDGTVEPPTTEDKRYQWLPTNFNVSKHGDVKITSRVNGLDEIKYPEVIPEMEKAFATVLKYIRSVIRKSKGKDFKIKNRTLQVIPKIAIIELNKGKPSYEGGVWHVEGTPYEHIIASVVHYLSVDEGVTPSFLEFRKPVVINEEHIEYEQNDEKYTTVHFGVEKHHEGVMNRYLGLIKCETDKAVIFPNYVQHRVKPFKLEKGHKKGYRAIMTFFIVDPDVKILGTEDVIDSRSYISEEEAIEHRANLMKQRKFFVDELNQEVFEREYSLCEH
jgi:hypothetical protein